MLNMTCPGAGDEIELRAIADIFGRPGSMTAVSSTKGATGQPSGGQSHMSAPEWLRNGCELVLQRQGLMLIIHAGHLLGAAGAVEALFTVLALHNRAAPCTVNLMDQSPGLPETVQLLGSGAQHALPAGPTMALSNSFGFGGTNACLVFSTPPEH